MYTWDNIFTLSCTQIKRQYLNSRLFLFISILYTDSIENDPVLRFKTMIAFLKKKITIKGKRNNEKISLGFSEKEKCNKNLKESNQNYIIILVFRKCFDFNLNKMYFQYQ